MSGNIDPRVQAYSEAVASEARPLFAQLLQAVSAGLPGATLKLWHGGPVWFVGAEPRVGLTQQKRGIQLLFWSGQLFDEAALKPCGKFKAAEFMYRADAQPDQVQLSRWLKLAMERVWDYPGQIAKLRQAKAA